MHPITAIRALCITSICFSIAACGGAEFGSSWQPDAGQAGQDGGPVQTGGTAGQAGQAGSSGALTGGTSGQAEGGSAAGSAGGSAGEPDAAAGAGGSELDGQAGAPSGGSAGSSGQAGSGGEPDAGGSGQGGQGPIVGWPDPLSASCQQCLPDKFAPQESCGKLYAACMQDPEHCGATLQCVQDCLTDPVMTMQACVGQKCWNPHMSEIMQVRAIYNCLCCGSSCKGACQAECTKLASPSAGPVYCADYDGGI